MNDDLSARIAKIQDAIGRHVDKYYLRRACDKARESPDPSTRNGAFLVGHGWACVDCNRYSTLPFTPEAEERVGQCNADRDTRLAWIEHAERNALFTAVREGKPTAGSTLYCPFAACTDCARAIVLLGVKRVVRLPAKAFDGFPERWRKSIAIADEILKEGNVTVDEFPEPLGETYWLDGKEWKV